MSSEVGLLPLGLTGHSGQKSPQREERPTALSIVPKLRRRNWRIRDLGTFRGPGDQICLSSRKYRAVHGLESIWDRVSRTGR